MKEKKSELSFREVHRADQAPVFMYTGLIIYLNTVSLPREKESKTAAVIGGAGPRDPVIKPPIG